MLTLVKLIIVTIFFIFAGIVLGFAAAFVWLLWGVAGIMYSQQNYFAFVMAVSVIIIIFFLALLAIGVWLQKREDEANRPEERIPPKPRPAIKE